MENVDDNEKERRIAEDMRNLVRTISSYPVESSWDEKEKAKKKLIRIYSKANKKLKGLLIFHIHEKLSKFKKYRDIITISDLKKDSKGPINIGVELIEIFDYPSSIEGILDFMDILEKIDDPLSIKLLSYHIGRYLLMPPNNATKLLLTRAVEILGKSETPYALQILIETFPRSGDKIDIIPVYISAAKEWKKKLRKVKMDKSMKDFYKEKLDEIVKLDSSSSKGSINYYA